MLMFNDRESTERGVDGRMEHNFETRFVRYVTCAANSRGRGMVLLESVILIFYR